MPTAGKGTYRELLRQGEHLLRRRVHPAPCDDAATDAFLLLEKVSGLTRTNYPLKKDERYPQAEREEYLALLRRRAAGEPPRDGGLLPDGAGSSAGRGAPVQAAPF